MDKPQIVAYIQKPVNFTLYHCNWIPQSAKFVVLGSQPNGTGSIQVYELEDGDAKLVRDVRKAKAFKCGTFGSSAIGQHYYATGDFDGRLQVWNLEDTDTTVFGVQAHDEIINCIDGVGGLGIGEGAPELVTGSRDGCVRVWDTRQKHDPVARMEPRAGEPKRDCWSVAFGDAYSTEDRCVAAGYDNGDVKLFDLRAMSVRWTTNVRNGVCSVEFDRKDIEMNKLAVTTLESHLHVFDLRTQHPVNGFASVGERAHKSTIWTVRHVPQNRDLFATCGGNGGVCLWKYDYPTARRRRNEDGSDEGVPGTVQQLQNVNLATQPINSLDWCKEKLGLAVTTAFDQTIRVLVVTKLNTY